jgi:acyl-CoA synthetase (AMP-forming)/AMP-acid ligase II
MPGHFLHDLQATFGQHAARPALIYGGRTWTYSELDAVARDCAAWLQSLGIAAGDRVALFTPNKLPFLIGHLGVMFAGGVPLPLNPRFTREEMRYFLTDSGARLVIGGREQQSLAEHLASGLPQQPIVVADALALDPPAADWCEPSPNADEACLILYSSGTTGWPKGVVHTHANVASSLAALALCWRMTAEDVVVNVLPLFHIHGLAFATHLTWLTGGCLLVEDAFDPLRTLDAIGRGTVFMAVPPIYYRLLEEPKFRAAAKQWENVRLFTCGSAPIRPEVLPELEAILGKPVINRYGMTEAYVIASLPLDGPWPYGSVGLPLAGVELSVVRDDGAPAAVGEVGSVRVRGPNLFREYWNKPEATAEMIRNGWLHTGDIATMDEDGFFRIVDRLKDIILVSGFNVYPTEVEGVLYRHPDVLKASVVGVPDDVTGERVKAFIVLKEGATATAAEIMQWCRDPAQGLTGYRVPREIEFRDSLPETLIGKVLRRVLLEEERQKRAVESTSS